MTAKPMKWSEKFSDDAEIERIAEELAGSEAIARMDEVYQQGVALLNEFYETLPSGSLTKRSIERGDTWSETASWARREGYDQFSRELDDLTWTYNGLVPDFLAD